MQDTGKTLCPSCTGEIPAASILCEHCGHQLKRVALSQALRRPDLYEIVSHGEKFAIVHRGEVKINSLDLADLPKAKRIVAILNSFIEGEKVE